MPLYLTEADVNKLVTIQDAIESVENGFMVMSQGGASNLPRQRLRLPRGIFNMMSAASPVLGVMGLKAYTAGIGQVDFHIQLSSTVTGELLAIIEGSRLGQLRTGAASGVATKYMARADASSVGLIGTGNQAMAQLQSVCNVRPITSVNVFSRTAKRRETFASQMSHQLGITVSPAKSAEACVSDCDIIIVITNARIPVLEGRWLAEGTHINAVGANSLDRRELDEETIRKSSFVVVDDLSQARVECGDVLFAVDRGIIRWEQVRSLSEVVGGTIRGRKSRSDITLFESQGIALEDIALGVRTLEIAHERGIGTRF